MLNFSLGACIFFIFLFQYSLHISCVYTVWANFICPSSWNLACDSAPVKHLIIEGTHFGLERYAFIVINKKCSKILCTQYSWILEFMWGWGWATSISSNLYLGFARKGAMGHPPFFLRSKKEFIYNIMLAHELRNAAPPQALLSFGVHKIRNKGWDWV